MIIEIIKKIIIFIISLGENCKCGGHLIKYRKSEYEKEIIFCKKCGRIYKK